jgi:hypothetical protein
MSGAKFAGSMEMSHRVSKEKVREIENKIADLKARWPAHSVPPSMWQQLEELEAELEEAKKAVPRKPDS